MRAAPWISQSSAASGGFAASSSSAAANSNPRRVTLHARLLRAAVDQLALQRAAVADRVVEQLQVRLRVLARAVVEAGHRIHERHHLRLLLEEARDERLQLLDAAAGAAIGAIQDR